MNKYSRTEGRKRRGGVGEIEKVGRGRGGGGEGWKGG